MGLMDRDYMKREAIQQTKKPQKSSNKGLLIMALTMLGALFLIAKLILKIKDTQF